MDVDTSPLFAEVVVREIDNLRNDLTKLLVSQRRRFASLKDSDVPCTSGLYIIYAESPLEAIYVGKASVKNKAVGTPNGLCFRIMKNHLAYQGEDNFEVCSWLAWVRVESRSPFVYSCVVFRSVGRSRGSEALVQIGTLGDCCAQSQAKSGLRRWAAELRQRDDDSPPAHIVSWVSNTLREDANAKLDRRLRRGSPVGRGFDGPE